MPRYRICGLLAGVQGEGKEQRVVSGGEGELPQTSPLLLH